MCIVVAGLQFWVAQGYCPLCVLAAPVISIFLNAFFTLLVCSQFTASLYILFQRLEIDL